MKLPTPPGPHFSVDDLVQVCTSKQCLDVETEARAIHHLALLCPQCWAAFDALPELADCQPTSITGLGLLRLKTSPAVSVQLNATHRAAVAGARSRPLGFSHLLLEECWLVERHRPTSGPFGSLPGHSGPILANGASLWALREAHDLQARLLTLFAHAYSYYGDLERAGETVALARAHLRRGRGEAEPEATVLEIEGQVAYWNGQFSAGRALLEEARQAVEGYEPADREAEILLRQGMLLAGLHADGRPQAAAAYRKGLAILDQLAPGTNPLLRLDLNHELAVVEADGLFYQRLLGHPYHGPEVAVIEQMVREADYWQDDESTRPAERAEVLGKLAVFTDPDRARAAFREAMGHYRRISEPYKAAKLLRELLYLWARGADCGTPWVNLKFLVGLWDLPQAEPFFREIVAEVEPTLAIRRLGETLADQAKQLRRAVRAHSQRAGGAARGGAER